MKELTYYTAKWCGPCKAFGPVMGQLSAEGVHVNKIDVDDNPEQAKQDGVRSVPTVILKVNKVEVQRWIGIQSKQEIKQAYINS